MRVLVLGADGYLGWPTAMDFSLKGHDVWVVDNYFRRNIARDTCSEPLFPTPNLHGRIAIFEAHTGKKVQLKIGDCTDFRFMEMLFKEVAPNVVIHYAEQPSAPYSMMGFEEASRTLNNNINATFNVVWAAISYAPDCHIIKLGTMGEYGTPNIDIEEGWLEVNHNGRSDQFLFPRQASSLYHTTKILDTDLLWFYVRTYGLRVTDLMQGPVYGLETSASAEDDLLLPNFHYDDIFGTVVNRFLVQAVAGIPLTVYGQGGQTRGYLNLKDTLQCVDLAMHTPAKKGELRILNQFTEQFTVNELAEKIHSVGSQIGVDVSIQHLENPRKELEEHYYNAKHSGLSKLGLQPNFMTDEVIAALLEKVMQYKDKVDNKKILPRVRWK